MILKVDKISKSFGGLKALDECSLRVKKREIVALIGPNGSGKSTLFNIISRLVKEDKGKILLHNKDLTEMEDFEVARQGVSRTFQDVRLFKNLTVLDHMEIALSEKNENLIKSVFTKTENFKKISRVLRTVNLDKYIGTVVTDLSYGQRKLLDLAIAVARGHDILMLDEPVAGVNPLLREKIKGILRNLRNKGETIFLIEHDMNFVMGLADYIYVLDYGKVIAHGRPDEIKNNKKVLEAYLGE